MPLLREPREDIPPLVHRALTRAAMKKDVRAASRDAMSALLNSRWPGNVRELEHAIERAVILEARSAPSEFSIAWPPSMPMSAAILPFVAMRSMSAAVVASSNVSGYRPTMSRAPELPSAEADAFAHLTAVVRGETKPNALSSVENNLLVVEVLDAARESAMTGRRVVLEK